MDESVRYGGWTFRSDFLFATNAEGLELRFSRAERTILATLTERAGTVFSRERLLDELNGLGSDSSDRNIDFMINRLRRKIGDAARKPAYIATQYGEGYVWIAERIIARPQLSDAFLVIGPVAGLAHAGPLTENARGFCEALRERIDRKTSRDKCIVLDESCPPADAIAGKKPRFSLELSFLVIAGRLSCALSLRVFATGQIVTVSRRTVFDEAATSGTVDIAAVETVAEEITSAIWDVQSYRAGISAVPTDEPLPVRLHNAALLMTDPESWKEGQQRLRETLERNPDDHRAKLMLATIVHTKYVRALMILPHQDFRAQDEDEMERLVLESLPHLQDNPIFVMAAAKLLYFLDRGHRPLALHLAEAAFASSTAFATSFAVWGQMRAFEGDLDDAVRLYEQGLELCRDNLHFALYLMMLRCQARLASGSREATDAACEAMYRKAPDLKLHLSHLYTSGQPGQVLPETLAILDRLDQQQARAIIVWINYMSGRLFRREDHRENYLRGPMTLFARRFGEDVVADEVRASVPALFRTDARARRLGAFGT